ncbi:MAG: accessory Sec system translocase SecA2 [Lachnospiraceae bacterium]|nr:accessory Sec system translocase SecA2 [Lachnospiraceae bacterium]
MNKWTNALKLKKYRRILNKIKRFSTAMGEISDEELQSQTFLLKERLKAGEAEDAVMPAAYAAMYEAMRRVMGISLYDVQILGAIAMFEGKLAEMKTGEGKTFTAVLPLYMNALTGRSTILVTTNTYLAIRDADLLTPLYNWMDLSCAVGVPREPGGKLEKEKKKEIYAADIVYTTNGALGFDYLMENLLVSREDRYLRPFDFVVIDEADSVLLDAAQTPLVISGMPKVQSNLYDSANYFVTTLKEGDYEVKEKDAWLTSSGIQKAERFFDIVDLYDGKHYDFVRHIMLALRAHYVFEKDRQYVVEDQEVKLLDANTGRILEKTRLQAGQHQALEAKEDVPHTKVHRAMASITFQDFFNMFPKIAGMTGTAAVDAAEFREIYGMDVVNVPTNRKVIRSDQRTLYYTSLEAELYAAMDCLEQLHDSGRPVLVVAGSIAMTDIISQLLLEMEIPHNVLNAYNTAKEAEIIAEAGRINAVTVATSVAGRGTDIKLGEGVAELGGLAVLGIGRMENRRLELQARGRAGRQGDPGSSQFFVSLEDKVVQEHGKLKFQKYAQQNRQIWSPRLKRAVRKAQSISEERERTARKSTQQYGESIRLQRERVYEERRRIQNISSFEYRDFMKIERGIVEDFMNEKAQQPDRSDLIRFVLDNITYNPKKFPDGQSRWTKKDMRKYLLQTAADQLQEKIQVLENEEKINQYFRIMILKAIDEAWIEEVDYLQQLKALMEGRQYTQRNMMFEYHVEAYHSYEEMQKRIKVRMMKNILLGEIQIKKDGDLQVVLP